MTDIAADKIDDVSILSAAAPRQDDGAWPSLRHAYAVAWILAIIQMCNALNNGVTTLLVESIKRDLQLTDMQIGSLLGFASVLFYALIGIPAARLVDRYNRKWLLTASIVVWSAATGACGLASTYWQLFAARFGIGAGESINGPLSYSLLADYFPPDKLPRGIAVYNVGLAGGHAISMLLAAALITMFAATPTIEVPLFGVLRDWQMVFLVTGFIGIPVALLAILIAEPKRRGIKAGAIIGGEVKAPGLLDVFVYLFRRWRLYAPMFLGLSFTSIHMMGVGNWIAAFFARTYGWQPATFGYYSGTLTLVLTPVALLVAIWANEYFRKRGFADTNMRVMAIGISAAAPFMIAAPLMPTPWLALLFNGLGPALMLVAAPSLNTALQIITPNEMRGRVTAIYLFVVFGVGGAVGPTLFAFLTQYVFGDESLLRYAIALSAGLMFPASALVYWLGVGAYRRRILEMRAEGLPV